MNEHIVRMRVLYYCEVQLFYASAVGLAAWLITSVRGCSATVKYWIWVAAALNFMLPLGVVLDKSLARYLSWAPRLAEIGDLPVRIAKGPAAPVLCIMWSIGAIMMLVRFALRMRAEQRGTHYGDRRSYVSAREWQAYGIPVVVTEGREGPSVSGVLSSRISLPQGIDHLLSKRELNAVLIHELKHARRRDNLVWLMYEVGRCLVWFHPLVWITGSRLALYRELSCDELVIQEGRGRDLVSALAKLANASLDPSEPFVLHARLTSHLKHRLSRLTGSPEETNGVTSGLLGVLFAGVLAWGVLGIVADTVSCFLVRR